MHRFCTGVSFCVFWGLYPTIICREKGLFLLKSFDFDVGYNLVIGVEAGIDFRDAGQCTDLLARRGAVIEFGSRGCVPVLWKSRSHDATNSYTFPTLNADPSLAQ